VVTGAFVETLAIPAANAKKNAAATAAVNMIFFMMISRPKGHGCLVRASAAEKCDGQHIRVGGCDFSHTCAVDFRHQVSHT
jgi:hypothetical protein